MRFYIRTLTVSVVIILLFIFSVVCERNKSPVTYIMTEPISLENTAMYETVLTASAQENYSVYFATEDPEKIAGYHWIRVNKYHSNMLSILMDAFQRGRPIQVWLGEPFNDYSGHECATVYSVKIIGE